MTRVSLLLLAGTVAVLATACGGSTGKGTVVGGIEPGGAHPIGTYVAGTVRVSDSQGQTVARAAVSDGHRFRLELSPGRYTLTALEPGFPEPCVGHARVTTNATVIANVVCAGK